MPPTQDTRQSERVNPVLQSGRVDLVLVYEVQRRALARETIRVETQFGAIDVKVARGNNGNVNAMPEFDQCRAAATAANVPLREVQEAARQAYLLQNRER